MAIKLETVAAVAREYTYQVTKRGVTGAWQYLKSRFGLTPAGGLSVQALSYIVQQAQTAKMVSGKLAKLQPTQRLNEALGGLQPPNVNVGVRVRAFITMDTGNVRETTMYVRMQWHDYVSDVGPAALDVARQIFKTSSKPVSLTYEFIDGTWWDVPASYLKL